MYAFVLRILASLNLPASIEDLSGAKVPQSVLDKSAAIKEKGGVSVIDRMMQDLPELLTRNREILDEVRPFYVQRPPFNRLRFLETWHDGCSLCLVFSSESSGCETSNYQLYFHILISIIEGGL